MLRIGFLSVGLVGAFLLGNAPLGYASIIVVDPSATFLRVDGDDPAPNAMAVDLASLPFAVNPGDFLQLERVGDFDFGPGGDVGVNMIAVFSSSSTLLAGNNLHRVPGAIDAGKDAVTGLTNSGAFSDIAEDFFVPGQGNFNSSVIVEVPGGAAFLFFSASDSYNFDNSDPDGSYGVKITSVNPEPSSLAVFVLVGTTILLLRRLEVVPWPAA